MSHQSIPSHTTVLIIGGGPAGAYAASVLAREGIQATVLEAAKFPRYHVGESMLPSLSIFMNFIGAEDKLRSHGFTAKPGAAIKFNQHKREGYTDFIRNDPRNGSWNVIRSELDEMLLRHAEESGATVIEETKVSEITFESGRAAKDLRPIGAHYVRTTGESGSISFDYLIDASGRNGIMSTKYLQNRRMNKNLHNIACWGYWTGHHKYMPGTNRENAPFFEALTDESGWAWFIPLHNGSVSVGIVMDSEISNSKKTRSRIAAQAEGKPYSLKNHYLDQLELLPTLRKLLEGAVLRENDKQYEVKSASDFSYVADNYAGDHYRLIGDASAFIDPFFSSGVHLAILGGLTAAMTIAAPIRKQCAESDAVRFHHVKVSTSYTRFFVVVMSAYKQIRNQMVDVLADVDEENFDRAFDILRPVIQGTADAGKKLTEDELQKTMDFCKDIFAPTDPEMHQAVGARVCPELLSRKTRILSSDELREAVDPEDKDAIHVVNQINASKHVGAMYTTGPESLLENSINGYVAHLERGSLGLRKV